MLILSHVIPSLDTGLWVRGAQIYKQAMCHLEVKGERRNVERKKILLQMFPQLDIVSKPYKR